jgi:hypothetical protein
MGGGLGCCPLLKQMVMVKVNKINSFYSKYKAAIGIITFLIAVAAPAIYFGYFINDNKNLRSEFNAHVVTDQNRYDELKHSGTDVAIRTEAKVDLLLLIYGIDPDKVSDFSVLIERLKSNPRSIPKADPEKIEERKSEIQEKIKDTTQDSYTKPPVSLVDLVYNIQYVPD